MAIVKTPPKGQIVISKKKREKLGIKPGAKIIANAVFDPIEIYPFPKNPAG